MFVLGNGVGQRAIRENGACWLICQSFAYMLERGQYDSLVCNSCKMHSHQGFWKTVIEVGVDWQLQALILNMGAGTTTELYEQIGIPRLNFQAYAYLKLNAMTVMIFISFSHAS